MTFIATPGGVLALWSAAELAADAGVASGAARAPRPGGSGAAGPPDGGASGAGFRGVAVSINLGSPAEVDAAIAAWVASGGSVTRTAAATEWGGYNGYVADPDGHLWELAHNPFWPLDERGLPTLPE